MEEWNVDLKLGVLAHGPLHLEGQNISGGAPLEDIQAPCRHTV